MCNKQKPFYNYNGRAGKKLTFFTLIAILVIISSQLSCLSSSVSFNNVQLSTSELDDLTEAVIARDLDALWHFRDHSDTVVRSIAWRAMAIAEFNDVDVLINHAIQSNDPGAWYALRFQELSPDHLDDLALRFYNNQIPKSFVCDLFYHHGDDRTLEMLLTDPDPVSEIYECSRAMGGILSRVRVPQRSSDWVIDMIVFSESDQTAENLLYGFWRSQIK